MGGKPGLNVVMVKMTWQRLNIGSRMPETQEHQEQLRILFQDSGMAASCLQVQQMALLDNTCIILPPNFLSKSDPSAICRILSETTSTKSISYNLDVWWNSLTSLLGHAFMVLCQIKMLKIILNARCKT